MSQEFENVGGTPPQGDGSAASAGPTPIGRMAENAREQAGAAADALRRGEAIEPLIRHTLSIKPERHYLVQGRASGSGGLLALSQTGG